MLSQLSAKHVEQADELGRVKWQNTAGDTVSDDLKTGTRACERPAKRVKMTCLCKDFSTTPSTAAFQAVLAGQDDFKNHCEALKPENQCIHGLAAETMKLQERIADSDMTDSAAKTTSKGCGKKRATAASRRGVLLEAELAKAKAAHVRLVEFAARSELGAIEARADSQISWIRLGGVG